MSRIRAIAATMILAAVLGSCGGDATGPRTTHQDPLIVTLTAGASSGPTMSDSPNGPVISCDIDLTATATGSGSATWGDATATWYVGRDRTNNPVGTTTNPSDDVVTGFGGATGISAGASQSTTWYFYNSAPFTVSIGFTYHTDDGRTEVASTKFTCGPDPSTAVVPAITGITLPSTTGTLKRGDTVTVEYQAASSSGIWATVVDATGAIMAEQVFGERLAASIDHTAKFVVKFANPGVPLTISVRAFDGDLEGTAKSLETQLKYVDTVPPTISYVTLAGQYAVGDTMIMRAQGNDDNKLGWFVYQLGPPANLLDSVAAAPDTTWQIFQVPVVVQPSWVGTPTLSLAIRDAGGLSSQTLTSAPDSIRFYPIVSHPATTPVTLSAADADDIVYDSRRNLYYIGDQDDHIYVLSPATMTVVATLSLPDEPLGMDLSLSGDSLLVTQPTERNVAVFDLTNLAAAPTTIRLSVLDTVRPVTSQHWPLAGGLRIAANGKMFVTLTEETLSGSQVAEVDLTTGAQRMRADASPFFGQSGYWRYLGRSPDRSHIVVLGTCWSRYSVSTDTFTGCGSGGAESPTAGTGVTFDASGTLAAWDHYVVHVSDSDMRVLWAGASFDGQPPVSTISPDSSTVYMAVGADLRTMRWSDRTMLERTPLPLPADRLFVGPDRKWLLALQTRGGLRATRVDLP